MIDIHSHILPGIDDGPLTLQTSLAMASISVADGISAVIATPHTDGIRVNHESVVISVARLNKELQLHNIQYTVYPGYEIPYHLVSELARDHTLAGSRYVLVEMPHDHVPRGINDTLIKLTASGFKTIIAHPERNYDVIINPEIMEDITGNNIHLQITAASITGDLGPDIQKCALYLLQKDMVHYVATDSHSPSFREPVLSKAFKVVSRLTGKTRSRVLFHDNPLQIIGSQSKQSQ